ncbi:MAG: hypothetical protein V2A65_02975 [Candidatus Omnitrophota bacterium]
MTNDNFWDDAEVIFSYTDEQAVEDGVVIPVKFGKINRVTRTILDDFIPAGTESTEVVECKEFFALAEKITREFQRQHQEKDDWFYSVKIDGSEYFVVLNETYGFTMMKPQDY